MGYARLVFPNTGTVFTTTVLHDIIGCVTGIFSSSVQLRGANTAASEIVNTLGQNWNIAHPTSSSFVPTTPSTNLASWILTAPCVNPSKIKYVQLTNSWRQTTVQMAWSLNQTGTGAGNLYSSTFAAGFTLRACTSASNASTPINPTFYDTNINDVDRGFNFTGTDVIVSWSSRHLVLWSNQNGLATANTFVMLGYVEFPETDVTQAGGTVPAAFLLERNGNLNTGITVYGQQGLTSNPAGDIQFPEFFTPTTFSTSTLSLNGVATSFDDITSFGSNAQAVNTIPTINSNGTPSILLMPIIVNLFSRGIPNMYLSAFSNMYIVSDGLGNGGDTLTVGNSTYAYLPSNTGYSFAIKKV